MTSPQFSKTIGSCAALAVVVLSKFMKTSLFVLLGALVQSPAWQHPPRGLAQAAETCASQCHAASTYLSADQLAGGTYRMTRCSVAPGNRPAHRTNPRLPLHARVARIDGERGFVLHLRGFPQHCTVSSVYVPPAS